MFHVTEITLNYRQNVGTYETMDDVIKFCKIVFVEADEENPGFFDAVTKHGQVFQIEEKAA